MLRSVLAKTLWERRISTFWWLVATLVLAIWLIAFYPAIRDSRELQDFIADFPPELLSLFGIDPALYTTGFGYLQAQLYSLIAPLMVISLCIGIGASATAKEEQDGTIDLILSVPISRTRIVVEKFGAMVVLALSVVLLLVVVLLVANPIVDLKLSIKGILGINLSLLLLGLLFGATAMAVGAWRGNRGLAAGVAGGLAIVAWFANGFAPLVGWLDTINQFLPFSWYLADDPLLNGPTWWMLLLATVGAIFLVLAVAAFHRRDVRSQEPLLAIGAREKPSGATAAPAQPGRFDWMLSGVFGKSIWERRATIWWWLLGLGGLAALTAAFWPTVQSDGDSIQNLIEVIPRELLAMFGITDPTALTTPEGFLSARLYSSIGTIIMLVFAIGMGAGTLAGEEQRGTMDLLLGTPTRRRRVARDKLGALIAFVLFLAAGLWIVVVLSSLAFDMGLDPGYAVTANIGLALLTLFFGVMAFAIGAGTGRPGIATGIAAGLAVAGFILNGFGAAIDWLEPARWLSPFFWYLQDSPPLSRGFSASYWLLVAGITVFAVLSIPAFRRRDLGT
jgi:ABC-2 type transport system permease protein